jgi:hypothetical protein
MNPIDWDSAGGRLWGTARRRADFPSHIPDRRWELHIEAADRQMEARRSCNHAVGVAMHGLDAAFWKSTLEPHRVIARRRDQHEAKELCKGKVEEAKTWLCAKGARCGCSQCIYGRNPAAAWERLLAFEMTQGLVNRAKVQLYERGCNTD